MLGSILTCARKERGVAFEECRGVRIENPGTVTGWSAREIGTPVQVNGLDFLAWPSNDLRKIILVCLRC